MNNAGNGPGNDAASPLNISAPVSAGCRAIVTIPARNEEDRISCCLDALARQVGVGGAALDLASFEVLILLNGCTDGTFGVVEQWRRAHPDVLVHVAERCFPPEQAHVGTARRLLMNAACERLVGQPGVTAILSTDSDSEVAPDWIAQNLLALERGADVVGGQVLLLPKELAGLPPAIRRCYEQDRRYAALVAQMEDRLDPRPGDRWPRHLDHFGSSLACTPRAYELAGGMPAVGRLEDEAFVDEVRRADLLLRHEPAVKVYTSARLEGRAGIGMATQLRMWNLLPGCEAHVVPSAAFVEYRFRFMRRLRTIYATKDLGGLFLPTAWWQETFAEALAGQSTCPGFLGAVYCDILIAESFVRDEGGAEQEPIAAAIAGLEQRLGVVREGELVGVGVVE